MKKILLIFVMLIFILPVLSADRDAETTLLTVVEDDEQRRGGTADLHLRIGPGTGKVFIDSFPLTRVDTQISTRFAKEIACDYTGYNCNNVDFFYTIRSNSPVVGGPSASGLMTVLTVNVLENRSMPDDITMTGTINSGGFIGPVSGIEEKTRVAEEQGFDTVIIPRFSQVSSEDNVTIFGDEFTRPGITVESVTTLDEALAIFGYDTDQRNSNITVPNEYQRVMGNVAQQLCQRADTLISQVDGSIPEQIQESYQEGVETLQSEDYYSAASFCFGSNVDLREQLLDNISEAQRDVIRQSTLTQAERFLAEIKTENIDTLSDLEASIIVKERLYEIINSYESQASTGYLVERLESARAWSSFFQYDSPDINLNEAYLQNACLQKVSEAEERVSYVEFLLPSLTQFREELNLARSAYRDEDYTYCLFKASKAKADANAVISSSQIPQEKEQEYITNKLELAQRQIAEQQGFFPILGYSYYNYASTLNDRPGLAITFSEYASEFSALDMYFETADRGAVPITGKPADTETLFVEGLLLGICLALFVTLLTVLVKKKKTQG